LFTTNSIDQSRDKPAETLQVFFLPRYSHFNFLLRVSEYITDYFYIFFDITYEFKKIFISVLGFTRCISDPIIVGFLYTFVIIECIKVI